MKEIRHLYTLVIPTFNRAQDVNDLLNYLDEKKVTFPVIVLDSSSPDVLETNRNAIGKIKNLDIHFVLFDSSIHPYDKLAQGLELVKTPYVQICADDDLIIPDQIEKSLQFLQQNPDYTACHGRYLNFKIDGDKRASISWEQYLPVTNDKFEPSQRIGELFRDFTCIFYAAFRTEQLQKWLANSARIESYLFKELFLAVMPAAEGKIARLREITHIRFAGKPAAPIDRWCPQAWILDNLTEFWHSYEKFRDTTLQIFSERKIKFPDGKIGRQVFDTSFFYYVRAAGPTSPLSGIIEALTGDLARTPPASPHRIRDFFLRALKQRRVVYPLKLSTVEDQLIFKGYLKLSYLRDLECLSREYSHFSGRRPQASGTGRDLIFVNVLFPALRLFAKFALFSAQSIRAIQRGRIQQIFREKTLNASAALLEKIGVQFIGINIYRIGHLAAEYDCLIKAEKLGLRKKYFKIIYPPFFQKPANKAFFKYVKKYAPVVTNKFLYRLLRPIAKHPKLFFDTYNYMVALNETSYYFGEILPKWGAKPSIAKVSEKDHRRGKTLLAKLGVDSHQWYVCLHARTEAFAPGEDQEYRNTDIETLDLAVESIIQRGGICIRMGDKRMPPLRPRRGLIDYAHSPFQNEFLDFYLSATCRFFLGSCSGLASIPVFFGRPVVSVNMSPTSHSLAYTFRDINIPKLIKSNTLDRILTMKEVMTSPISNFRYGFQFRNEAIEVIDNTPEEIRDAVIEMLDRLDGRTNSWSEAEPLQEKFRNLFTDGHYTWNGRGRVANSFLSRHRELLTDFANGSCDAPAIPANTCHDVPPLGTC